MNIDRDQDIYAGLNLIERGETFRFKCRACGKCCKNRNDVILTSHDLFRMAKELKKGIRDVIQTYCHSYIGSDSSIVIVTIQGVGANETCPFLSGKRCSLHNQKPSRCALFPLGRVYDIRDGRVRYFLQNVRCGSTNKAWLLEKWIENFGEAMDEDAFIYINQQNLKVIKKMREIRDQLPTDDFMRIALKVGELMYINYDLNGDFTEQYNSNMARIQNMLNRESIAGSETNE